MYDKKEKIAIILVNYNGLEDSIECVKSVYGSNNVKDISIIFVDNGSQNDESKLIKEYFPEIIAIRSEANNGFSAGNNIGIRYALEENYEYILILNNDTIIDRNMIATLKEWCFSDAISVPKMLYYSQPDTIWYGGGEINLRTGNAKHTNMNYCDSGNNKEKKVTFASGCCMMIKADIFRKIGVFEENFFMYCEDTEFCIRLAQNEIKINYVPRAKLWHKVSRSTGGSDSPFSTYYMTRNRLNYVKKYRSYFSITAYPLSLFSRYVRMISCKDNNVRKAFHKGILDHLKGISGKVEM